MSDLFNKEDVLTGITADKAVVGMKGFVGDSLSALNDKIKRNDVSTLTDIVGNCAYCFEVDHKEQLYAFFLPGERVMKPTYRPIATVDELFNFILPEFELVGDEYGKQVEFDAYRKAEILLGKKLVLKDLINDRLKIMIIQDINFKSDIKNSKDIFLNSLSLEYLFHDFEIQKNGEFVPFAIEERIVFL